MLPILKIAAVVMIVYALVVKKPTVAAEGIALVAFSLLIDHILRKNGMPISLRAKEYEKIRDREITRLHTKHGVPRANRLENLEVIFSRLGMVKVLGVSLTTHHCNHCQRSLKHVLLTEKTFFAGQEAYPYVEANLVDMSCGDIEPLERVGTIVEGFGGADISALHIVLQFSCQEEAGNTERELHFFIDEILPLTRIPVWHRAS